MSRTRTDFPFLSSLKVCHRLASFSLLPFYLGTCINNTSVMQFKKGSFEVGGTIYPVAIKYDAKFGDAFWNSSKNSMTTYLLMMMTSWAIVCDVWYLPPMKKEEVRISSNMTNVSYILSSSD